MKLDPRDLLQAVDLMACASNYWKSFIETSREVQRGHYDAGDREILDCIDEAERLSGVLAKFVEQLIDVGVDPTRPIEIKARQWNGKCTD